jgi:hypothetical protein
MQLIVDRIFAVSDQVRYVALYRNGALTTHQRDGVAGASQSETDRYEELFVNPVLLTAARQRGNVDCGGLRYIIVGYGNINQLVMPLSSGHISVCLESTADLAVHVEAVTTAVAGCLADVP